MTHLNSQIKKTNYTTSHALAENILMRRFLQLLQDEPKPPNMSKSVYLTYLAISILEQMGNKFPSQVEIDTIESKIKRYSLRKTTKLIFNQACQTKKNINLISKAA